MPQRTTLTDIANELGIHKSTVSLAIKGSPKIAQATRERVQAAAERMGYRPDPALSRIASYRWKNYDGRRSSYNLAYLVNPTAKHVPWQEPNQKRFWGGALKQANQHGYALDLFRLDEYPTPQSASRVLYERGIQGLILPPILLMNNPLSLNLDWDKFTTVCCSAGFERPPLNTVSDDQFMGTRLVWHELRARGYRRIGPALFGHQPLAEHDFMRYGAVLSEQVAHPSDDQIPIYKGHFSEREPFLEWVKKYEPDAVVSFHDHAYEWLVEAGYRVPEDIGVVSLHVFPEREHISGIKTLIDGLGSNAVDMLVSQIKNNAWGIPKTRSMLLLEPEWNEGKSIRPAAQ